MAANGRGHMRPNSAGRSPPFVVIGLLVVIGILGFNYWNTASKNSTLSADVEELSLKYRSTQSKKLEVERSHDQLQQKLEESNQRSQKLEQELKDKNYNLEEAIRKSDDLQARVDNIAQELEATKNDLNICDDDVGFCHENITRITIVQKKQIEELQMHCTNAVDEARSQAEQRAADVESSCQGAVQSVRISILSSIQHVFGTKALLLLNQQAHVDLSGIDMSATDGQDVQTLPDHQQQGVQQAHLNQPETQPQQQQQQQQQPETLQPAVQQQDGPQQPDVQQVNSQNSEQQKPGEDQQQQLIPQVAAPQQQDLQQQAGEQPHSNQLEPQQPIDQQDDLNPQEQQAAQQMNEGQPGQEEQRSQEGQNEEESAKAQEDVNGVPDQQDQIDSARNHLQNVPGLEGNVLINAAQRGYGVQQQSAGNQLDPYGRVINNNNQQEQQFVDPRYGNVINQGSEQINQHYDETREIEKPGLTGHVLQARGDDLRPGQAPAGQILSHDPNDFRYQPDVIQNENEADQGELIDRSRVPQLNIHDAYQQADQKDYLDGSRDTDRYINQEDDNHAYVRDPHDLQDPEVQQYSDNQAPVGDVHRIPAPK